MITTNAKKVIALIKEVIGSVPSDVLDRVVIFGSSAITLHEIDLEREVDDLDVFVSPDDYLQLKSSSTFQEQYKGDIGYLIIPGKSSIELWQTFPGVAFEEVVARASSNNKSSGLLVASMQDLCQWKRSQGRDKDLKDMGLMGC